MIHSSPSAMMPSGAMWTVPVPFIVVTIVSRIIGMSALGLRAQGVPGRFQPGAVLHRCICGASPVERLVLRVALAQSPGDFRLGQLGTEIERMRAIPFDTEPG